MGAMPQQTDDAVRTDVCVIGSGIVGLHNALQYARRGFRVAIVDELTERDKSTYKVGESLLIFSNPFLRTIGDLDKELSESFEKRGVWFAHGLEGKTVFDDEVVEWGFQSVIPQRWKDRIEDRRFGRTMFEDVQIVRPEIEAVLRGRLKDFDEITVVDRGQVRNVELGDGSDHRISWESRDGKQHGTVMARWMIDCSGRARFLVKRFGHDIPLDDGFSTSAVWAQFSHCTDDCFGDTWAFNYPEGGGTSRDRDTVHLWGDGYWIWLIRLTGDRISVGVSFNSDRPPAGGNLRQAFWEILRRYPLLDFLREENVLDFRAYRSVQYMTDTHVSPRRYAIVGDASSIIDAYYSQGISLSLSTSWHAANIAEADLRGGVLNTDYIAHVNRAVLADWQIMRSMVRSKYSTTIADSRFFLLDHWLDYLIFGAVATNRFRIVRWLTATNGDTRAETPATAKLRARLTRELFLSQSTPLNRVDPAKVASVIERCHAGVQRRAQWRLDHGIRSRPAKAVMRPESPLPAMWRLPYLRFKRRADLTVRAFTEPEFMRPRLSAKLPPLLAGYGPILVALTAVILSYDIADTAARRATHAIGRVLTDPLRRRARVGAAGRRQPDPRGNPRPRSAPSNHRR